MLTDDSTLVQAKLYFLIACDGREKTMPDKTNTAVAGEVELV